MMIPMLHSKIHRATVTTSDLHYEGSMGVDRAFLKETGMIAGQRVDVLDITNGERLSTYLIEEPEGSKAVAIYGAAAHKIRKGDLVIIIAYAMLDASEAQHHKARILLLGPGNEVMRG